MPKFKRNSFWHVKEIEVEMMERFGVSVTVWQCYRARFLAQNILMGTLEQYYGKCKSYLLEHMRIDLTWCFILQTDLNQAMNKSTFKRLYIS